MFTDIIRFARQRVKNYNLKLHLRQGTRTVARQGTEQGVGVVNLLNPW